VSAGTGRPVRRRALICAFGPALALRLPFAIAGVFQLLVGVAAWIVLARMAHRARDRISPAT
jgi:hypothetical protein